MANTTSTRTSRPSHVPVLGIAALCGGLATACAASSTGRPVIVVDGIEIYEDEWKKTTSELEQKVRFDFDCAEGAIDYTLFEKKFRYPTQIGVEACGGKGTYTRWDVSSPWVLNNRHEDSWEKTKADLEQRARFDFECPDGELEFVRLDKGSSAATEIGVRACGGRGTYTRPDSTGAWTLDMAEKANANGWD